MSPPTHWTTDYSRTLSFLRDFWMSEAAPRRPGIILHQYQPVDTPTPTDLDPERQKALEQVHGALHGRVRNGDDYIPRLSTNNGTSAMASAFGTELQDVGGGHWAETILSGIEEVDHLEKPPVTEARVGEALEFTRALKLVSDLPICSLDLQSPLTVATQLLGVTELFMAMYDAPRRVHRLLEIITDFFIDVVEAQREIAGEQYAPVFWPHIWSPAEVGLELADDYLLTLSPDLYEEFSIPCLNCLSRHFGGLFMHSCSLYSHHLPVLRKIESLRGVNCDLCMAAPVRDILDALDGIVFSPQVYMNKEITLPSQAEWLKEILDVWEHGDRLMPVVLAVIYDDAIKGDQQTDWEECQKAWRKSGTGAGK